jgi:hypothetical protein
MQIFPRTLNLLPLVGALGAAVAGGAVTFGFWYYGSPKYLQVGYEPEQPIEYSHELHAGTLGIDCRYCHSSVEVSQEAMVPPTQTCMGCHAVVRTDSELLEPLRVSWRTGEAVPWVRVHKLPDHAFFDHSVHVNAGVGCVSCHGRIDKMVVVGVDEPISMGWCLDCHRDPGSRLRPPSEVTNMEWADPNYARSAEELAALNPPTHCSGCHR